MADQAPTKHGKRRRNFYLPETLMDEVNDFASRHGVSMTQVLTTALIKFLGAAKKAEEERRAQGH
jgi:hypothetical protein